MKGTIVAALNRATEEQLAGHLHACDAGFLPRLSTRVNIGHYAQKMIRHATRFEAWAADELAGLVAMYCNDRAAEAAFITNVSVLPDWQGHNIATDLVARSIDHAWARGIKCIKLSVHKDNAPALAIYRKLGFTDEACVEDTCELCLCQT